MKIIFISYSFKNGGAAIAAAKFAQIASILSDIKVITQAKAGVPHFLKRLISFMLSKTQYDFNPIKHSLNLFSYTPVLNAFHRYKDRLFHVHWINNDTLSVFDLDVIPSGTIITLHDEWLYCGAEHYYKVDDPCLDFIDGYRFFKKSVWGIHWNYFIWKIKLKSLKNRIDLIYTVPSTWMLSRAKQSIMLQNSDIRLLPNPIDIEIFSPSSQLTIGSFRRSIGIIEGDIILAFGAIGGKTSYLKGGHLLDDALRLLSFELAADVVKSVKLVNFGGKSKKCNFVHGFYNISLGHIKEQNQLALLYSSADFVVVPSLVESFGQVAAEALSCETPVVCFNYSGLTDIVNDENGLLVKPYCVADLAEKLKRIILMNIKERSTLGQKGRAQIIEKFSYPVVSKLYGDIINEVNAKKQNKV